MPRQNPANPRPASAPADTGSSRKLGAEEIGQRLLRLLESMRVQSLSLHQSDGDLLWLSEGVFGPDEHGYVLEAMDLFTLETSRHYLERKLEDGRRALFLCARTPVGDACGLAMVIVEQRLAHGADAELSEPRVVAQMRRFSMLLAPPIAPRRGEGGPEPESKAPPVAAPTPRAPAAAPSAPPLRTPPRVVPTIKPAAPAVRVAKAAPAASPVARRSTRAAASAAEVAPIHARLYARLRPGGATRRFEVMGAPLPSVATDLALTQRVIAHLSHMREQYRHKPATVTVPLCAESISDSAFLTQVRPLLAQARLSDGILGFAVPAVAWSEQNPLTERFIAHCTPLRCFVALDDFNLGRSGFGLLRSPALRALKLDPELIAGVMQDKYCQATLAAIVQAARVLGLYCVAKQVDSQALAQWLAGAGVEFSDNFSRDGTAASTTKSAEDLTLEGIA